MKNDWLITRITNKAAKWPITVQMNTDENFGKILKEGVTNVELNEDEVEVSCLPIKVD